MPGFGGVNLATLPSRERGSVAATQVDIAQRAAYWPVPIVRAVTAAGLALAITFTADHSARFGLLAFGIFAVVSGTVITIAAVRRLATSPVRSFVVTQGIITVVFGLVCGVALGGGVRYLFLIVTGFAAITGLLELYSGVRSRRRFVASADWIAVGVLTTALAVIFLLVPPEYTQVFHGPDNVMRVLDASVVAVGVLGAYAAIIAVYLVIAGLSAKWGTQVAPDAIPSHAETISSRESENKA